MMQAVFANDGTVIKSYEQWYESAYDVCGSSVEGATICVKPFWGCYVSIFDPEAIPAVEIHINISS